MNKRFIAAVLLSLATAGAYAKLPPLTEEQKAKAEEAKAKAGEAAKKDAELLAGAQDKVVARYQCDSKKPEQTSKSIKK